MHLLKTQIQLIKFEDLIDFIKWFIDQAAAHPAAGRAPRGCADWKDFTGTRVGKEAIDPRKEQDYFLF